MVTVEKKPKENYIKTLDNDSRNPPPTHTHTAAPHMHPPTLIPQHPPKTPHTTDKNTQGHGRNRTPSERMEYMSSPMQIIKFCWNL